MELRGGTQTTLRASGSDLFVDHQPVPEIIWGTATLLDAQNNPTPDPALHDPAAYAEGSLLIATAYPAPIDNGTGEVTTFHGGDMQFRRVGGAGAEAWEWVAGSFRASNANGDYVRNADGSQECSRELVVDYSQPHSLSKSWTYPAAFVSNPKPTAMAIGSTSGFPSQGDRSIMRATVLGTSSLTLEVLNRADSPFVSGNSTNVALTIEGPWKA